MNGSLLYKTTLTRQYISSLVNKTQIKRQSLQIALKLKL